PYSRPPTVPIVKEPAGASPQVHPILSRSAPLSTGTSRFIIWTVSSAPFSIALRVASWTRLGMETVSLRLSDANPWTIRLFRYRHVRELDADRQHRRALGDADQAHVVTGGEIPDRADAARLV